MLLHWALLCSPRERSESRYCHGAKRLCASFGILRRLKFDERWTVTGVVSFDVPAEGRKLILDVKAKE